MFKELELMNQALIEAKKALKLGNVPVGCIITYKNKVIAHAHNEEFWHAEIICIKRAQESKGKFLNECTMIVTLKPCKMCMHAIKLARIKKVIYGCSGAKDIKNSVELYGNIRSEECSRLMIDFFNKKRK